MASFRNLLGLPVKDWDSRAAGQVLTLSDDKEHWELGTGGEGNGIHIDNRVSTYANLPNPPTEGTGATYLVDADGLLYVWDGSSWPAEGEGIAVGGGGSQLATFPVPQLTDFDPPIGTSSVWEQRDNRITLALNSATIANVWLMQNLPSAPFTIDAELGLSVTAAPSSAAALVGIGVSDGTKIRSIYTGYWSGQGTDPKIELGTLSDAQTYSGNTFHYGIGWDYPVQRTYIRITDDGTNRNYWSSNNGRDWCGWIGTVGEANTVGIGTATKACLYARTAPGIGTAHAFIYGWRVSNYVRGYDD